MNYPDNFSQSAFDRYWGNEQTDLLNEISELEDEIKDLKIKRDDLEEEFGRITAEIEEREDQISSLKSNL